MFILRAAGCSDPSYEDITGILASSSNTQLQDIASIPAQPAESNLQPAVSSLQPAETDTQPLWDADVSNVRPTDNSPALQLQEGSVCQAEAVLADVPLVSESAIASLPAAGEAAALSGSIDHSYADDTNRQCLQSHSTNCSMMSRQDSSHSTCSHSSRQSQLSSLHEAPSVAAGPRADAPGAVPRASGLVQKGDLNMQGTQASPAGLRLGPITQSVEPITQSMEPITQSVWSITQSVLALPTCPSAEHDSFNHQTLNPAQQTLEKHPTLPMDGKGDLNQSSSVHQARAGLQAQTADSELHRTEHSSQRAYGQAPSTDTATVGGESQLATAFDDATSAQVS